MVQERTRKLNESETRYRAVVEDQTEFICRLRPDWTLTFVNDAYCKCFGKRPDELIGHTFAPLIVEEDREKVRNAQATITPEKPVVLYEERVVTPNGEIRWQEWSSRGIFDEEGNLVEIQGVGRDITERKQMEEKLRNSERYVGIGQAARMVGHDLRNPLQVIVNRVFLAKTAVEKLSFPYSEVAEKLGLKKMFEELESQTSYMNKIVSDLQDYSRPVTPEPVSTNVNKLLDETFSTITVPANVEVSRQIEENVSLMMIDPESMRRALTNLIRNAIQAMPNGGKLIVRVSRSDEAFLISVQDTGEGISQENLEKLWIPLFTTKAKGQGLGLPVCKRIVEAHGGIITVNSKSNEGSTFTIKLPLNSIASVASK